MITIGSRLREERRRKGLKLAEAGSATLIPERHLAALEEDRFDLLPAGSYRRSFLREYADYLGLNGDAYANEYQEQLEATEPVPLGPRRPGIGVTRPLRELPLTRALTATTASASCLHSGFGSLTVRPDPFLRHRRSGREQLDPFGVSRQISAIVTNTVQAR
jgi:transcriptional regulator with XRE-family HTH domain